MARTAFVNTRIEPALKEKAEKVFSKIGISATTAVTMFYQQVVLRRGIPFDVCIPNAKTLAALEEADRQKGEIFAGSTEDIFADILGSGNNRR